MPKFRLTTTVECTTVVEAENPFQAAVLVGGNVSDLRPARGRVGGSSNKPSPAKATGKLAKKRKPMSPESEGEAGAEPGEGPCSAGR
jgi:hypothetical protein